MPSNTTHSTPLPKNAAILSAAAANTNIVITTCVRPTLPLGINRSGWLMASTSRSHHSLMTCEKPVSSGPAMSVPMAILPMLRTAGSTPLVTSTLWLAMQPTTNAHAGANHV